MPPKYTSEILKAEIKALEIRQAEEGKLLKAQMVVTYKSLNPVLLVHDAFKELTTSPKLKESIVETLVGMGSGFLAKRMIFGKTNNRFLRFGRAGHQQYGIAQPRFDSQCPYPHHAALWRRNRPQTTFGALKSSMLQFAAIGFAARTKFVPARIVCDQDLSVSKATNHQN